MTITNQRTAGFTAVLIAALTALAFAAPLAGAVPASPPPKLSGKHMHWYRWHPSTRALQGRTAEFGSIAVLGLESMHDLASLRAAYGFEHVRAISALRAAEVSVNGTQLRALLADAPTDPRIRYVAPVGPPRRAMSMPNDPLLHTIDGGTGMPYEWQFPASRVDRALDFSRGDPAIVVGTIDTGAANVPDLAGKVDGRWSFAQDGTPISVLSAEGNDAIGHGTAVASLIAANVDDGFGMAGFGGATHVIAFHAGGLSGFPDTSTAVALTKLVSLGARIVNMSIGGSVPSEPILVDAIHKAAAEGVLLVASAGNEHAHVSWPAANLQPSGGGRSYGLAVGATDVDGELAYFSNSGKHLSLVAPGNYGGTCSGVLVALPQASLFDDTCNLNWFDAGGAHYAYLAGTSFAAPEVAGIAALIWAARPDLKNYEVADIIKQSARRDTATDWTPTMGCGLLDAGAALELATSGAGVASGESDEAGEATCSAAGDQPPAWPAEASQTITFDPLGNKTLGDPDFVVSATASSGLPVSFVASGNCTVSGATVRIIGAGSCTITASQPGDADYEPAPDVSQSFVIAARTVLALAAFGRWGAPVKLPFRVSAGSGEVAVNIAVQRNRTTVAHLSRGFVGVEVGRIYTLPWRAPKAKTKGFYRFCVTLSGGAGNKSAPSCARIRLR